MHPFILHHYANSPFSEKIRLVFGFKGMAWHSVHVPSMLPKPDVAALTGGYRRTPFLQRGADIWCDTALMARVIDRAQPTPPLYPPGVAGAAQTLAQWADFTLFWAVIPYTLQPQGIAHVMAGVPPEGLKAFAADRAPFTAGLTRQTPADATVALKAYLARLEEQLADGRAFLFGSQASIADFSVAHCLWFIHLAPPMLGILDPFARLRAWYARVSAFEHGTPTVMKSAEAITLAAAATLARAGAGRARARLRRGRGRHRDGHRLRPRPGGRHAGRADERGSGASSGTTNARAPARALPAPRVPDQEGSKSMKTFKGRTAVITGAGSGFGLEVSRIAAREGMNLVHGRRAAGCAGPRRRRRSAALGAQVLARSARRGQGRRGRGAGRGHAARASARRTSCSTTPASAPAG